MTPRVHNLLRSEFIYMASNEALSMLRCGLGAIYVPERNIRQLRHNMSTLFYPILNQYAAADLC